MPPPEPPFPLPPLCGVFATSQGCNLAESIIQIPFTEGLFAIGLDPEQCDYTLHVSHANLSSVQCVLKTDLDKFKMRYVVCVQDWSLNGTYLDGKALNTGEFTPVKDGSILCFGGRESLRFEFTFKEYLPGSLESHYDPANSTTSRGQVLRSRSDGVLYAVQRLDITGLSVEQRLLLARTLDAAMFYEHPNVSRLMARRFLNSAIQLLEPAPNYGSLEDFRRHIACFRENDAKQVVRQLCLGLRYLHAEKSTIHGNLSTYSILVHSMSPIVVKLGDVKFAQEEFRLTASRPDFLMYAAPELLATYIMGYYSRDVLVDSWSLGVVAFVMLSGQYPFRWEEISLDRAEDGSPAYDLRTPHWTRLQQSCVSNLAMSFIRGLLTRDPTCRMSMAEALKHPWLTS